MYSKNTLVLSIFVVLLFTFKVSAQKDSSKSSSKYWNAGSKEIWQSIDGLLNDPNLSSSTWGVYIQSMSSGEVLYKRNENKLLNSASLIKLITTSTALSVLGNDFIYETEIRTKGKIEGSELKGDLIVYGSGDPTISGKFYNDDLYAVFNNWADQLIELGIMEISGNLIGDDTSFPVSGLGEGWQWNYLSEWFAAPSSSLAFNDNTIDIIIEPDSIGFKSDVELNPQTGFATVINNISTVPNDSITEISTVKDLGTNIIRLSGSIKLNEKPLLISVAVESPTDFFLTVFKEVLHRRGIKVNGSVKLASDLGSSISKDNSTLLLKHKSKQLSEIIKLCNKNSINFYAEQILRTIGFTEYGFGSVENGKKVVGKYLNSVGISTTSYKLVDGSGLSNLNLNSAEQFAKLLRFVFQSDYFPYFYNSIPVAGRDGSLADRLLDASSANNLRGKPGLNEGVRSLAGYIKTADNESLSVVFISNNHLVPYGYIDNIIDKICNRLSILKRKK